MNRRFSDRVKTVGGMAILFVIGSHFIPYGTTSLGTDMIFAVFGALCGVLVNVED